MSFYKKDRGGYKEHTMRKPDNKRPAGAQRFRIGAMLFSLSILFIAMGITLRIGRVANEYDHQLYHMTEDLEGLQQNVHAMEVSRR